MIISVPLLTFGVRKWKIFFVKWVKKCTLSALLNFASLFAVKCNSKLGHIFNFEVSKWDYTQLLNTYTCTEDQFQCRDSSLPTVSPTNPTVSPSYGPSATPTRVPSVLPSVVTYLLYFRRINFCDCLSNLRCIIFFLFPFLGKISNFLLT